eukprot:COSAG01_NODE_5168_length_4438_cov_4.333026_1_plen_1066_part_00
MAQPWRLCLCRTRPPPSAPAGDGHDGPGDGERDAAAAAAASRGPKEASVESGSVEARLAVEEEKEEEKAAAEAEVEAAEVEKQRQVETQAVQDVASTRARVVETRTDSQAELVHEPVHEPEQEPAAPFTKLRVGGWELFERDGQLFLFHQVSGSRGVLSAGQGPEGKHISLNFPFDSFAAGWRAEDLPPREDFLESREGFEELAEGQVRPWGTRRGGYCWNVALSTGLTGAVKKGAKTDVKVSKGVLVSVDGRWGEVTCHMGEHVMLSWLDSDEESDFINAGKLGKEVVKSRSDLVREPTGGVTITSAVVDALIYAHEQAQQGDKWAGFGYGGSIAESETGLVLTTASAGPADEAKDPDSFVPTPSCPTPDRGRSEFVWVCHKPESGDKTGVTIGVDQLGKSLQSYRLELLPDGTMDFKDERGQNYTAALFSQKMDRLAAVHCPCDARVKDGVKVDVPVAEGAIVSLHGRWGQVVSLSNRQWSSSSEEEDSDEQNSGEENFAKVRWLDTDEEEPCRIDVRRLGAEVVGSRSDIVAQGVWMLGETTLQPSASREAIRNVLAKLKSDSSKHRGKLIPTLDDDNREPETEPETEIETEPEPGGLSALPFIGWQSMETVEQVASYWQAAAQGGATDSVPYGVAKSFEKSDGDDGDEAQSGKLLQAVQSELEGLAPTAAIQHDSYLVLTHAKSKAEVGLWACAHSIRFRHKRDKGQRHSAFVHSVSEPARPSAGMPDTSACEALRLCALGSWAPESMRRGHASAFNPDRTSRRHQPQSAVKAPQLPYLDVHRTFVWGKEGTQWSVRCQPNGTVLIRSQGHQDDLVLSPDGSVEFCGKQLRAQGESHDTSRISDPAPAPLDPDQSDRLNASVSYVSLASAVSLSSELVADTPEPRPNALNTPGHWDFMISYTQRNTAAELLAEAVYGEMTGRGKTVWLDIKMRKLNVAAMKEAAQNSRCIIAIVTGACVRSDPAEGEHPEDNAYFKRAYCVQELRWAREACVPIQPVILADDKKRIGDLLALAPEDLQDLGRKADFIHLDRSRPSYWQAGVDDILTNVADLVLSEGVPPAL